MSLLLLIALIVLIIKYAGLSEEVKRLRSSRINYCPKCGTKLIKEQPIENNTVQNNNIVEEKVNKEINKPVKPKMNDEEVKNNIILITGSILIILAAVVYLTSSWSSTSNILKCLVIFIMFFVFVLSSYIAKEKLKLTQTAKAFKYIALAYLPLSLISLSIFGLLGENFSLNGTYQNLYFAITLFISSIIYYSESCHEKDKFLSILSVIASILGIFFLVKVFTNSLFVLLIFLYLYSYFLALLYEKKVYFYNEVYTKNILKVLFYSLLSILVILNIYLIVASDIYYSKLLQNIALLILNIGFSIYLNNCKLNKYIVPISIALLFFSLRSVSDFSFITKEVIFLLSIPVIYLYNYLTEKNINIFNFILSSFVVVIVFFTSFFAFFDISIPLYIITFIYVLLLVLTYFLSPKLKKAMTWMIPIFIELGVICLILEEFLSINILLGVSTILIIMALLPQLKDKSKELVIIPSVLNIIYILIAYNNKSLISFLFIVVSIVAYYLLFIRENKNYKYFAYIGINLAMIYLGHIICNGLNSYTMALSIIIIIALELIDERLKDNGNFIYILVDYVITALALTVTGKRTAFIMVVIIAMVLAAYLFDNKNKKIFYAIPLLSPLIYIGTSDVMTFNVNYMVLFSILIVVLVPFLIMVNKEFIQLAFVPYIYLLMQTVMDISLYFPAILAVCISIVYYLFTDKKLLFKIITSISVLLLYYLIINDLSLSETTVFTIGILLFYTIFITRNVMKEQLSEAKIIEYIVLIVLNLIAITSYVSEADGMLYVIILLVLTIYSYIRKYGPAFIVSIVFIVINVFLLTRLFWLSLPWWIYILGIGIVLILFAVINEINEKDSMKNKLKDIKNKLNI